jgi:uncharacterized protein YbcI
MSTSAAGRYECSSSTPARPNFTGTVEEITGRKVWAFVSGIDTQQDVASEVFYLEPVANA